MRTRKGIVTNHDPFDILAPAGLNPAGLGPSIRPFRGSLRTRSCMVPQKESSLLIITVYENNVEKALKAFKRKAQKEGLLKDIRAKRYYEKPSVKKKRKRKDAARKRAKALKFKRDIF